MHLSVLRLNYAAIPSMTPRIVLCTISLVIILITASLPVGAQESDALKRILILGDSLTDGFDVAREDSYPARLQEKVDAHRLPYEVINAGLSGDTSAGGLRRLDWLLRAPVDVLVLALGANDGLRGFPPSQTEENLEQIILKVKSSNPQVRILLLGMLAPPNMGDEFSTTFAAVYPAVAKKHSTAFMPFLLQDVAAEPTLNLEDGIHPNEAGYQRIADNIWPYLLPLLSKPEASVSATAKAPSNAK